MVPLPRWTLLRWQTKTLHVAEDNDNEELYALVVNIGSHTTNAGFAGWRRAVVYLFFDYLAKHCGIKVAMDWKDAYVGNEAKCKHGVLICKW
jgi:hypothetical protein